MLAAGVAEGVADLRSEVERRSQPIVLDVEDLQDARGTLVCHLLVLEQLGVRVEPFVQACDVLRTAVRVADRIQQQRPIGHAEPPHQLRVELDHLGVDGRIGRADRLE